MTIFFCSVGFFLVVVVISAVLPKVNVVSTICFLVGYDHCTENCCRCANFFRSSSFSKAQQQQQPFVAVALMAVAIEPGGRPASLRTSFCSSSCS